MAQRISWEVPSLWHAYSCLATDNALPLHLSLVVSLLACVWVAVATACVWVAVATSHALGCMLCYRGYNGLSLVHCDFIDLFAI